MNILEPSAHLDHMQRTTRLHHVQLSSMADLKASMILTLSSVLITLCAPQVMKPEMKWPALVLIGFCLLTIMMATYAVMPRVPFSIRKGVPPDVNSPVFNILFFGDFVRLSYDEFETAMEEVLNRHSRAYQAQVRELYTLGMFLATKKYRFVRIAYLTFIAGLWFSGALLVL